MILVSEFWAMGGYGEFVWPAYGVSILALVIIAVLSFRKMKATERNLNHLKEKKKKHASQNQIPG